MHTNTLLLDNQWLSFDTVISFINLPLQLALSNEATTAINQCRNYLNEKTADHSQLYYGINTGFGFCKTYKLMLHKQSNCNTIYS